MIYVQTPYISRVKILNYRNFKSIDVCMSDKQVLIGENNVGKTNFLRAIQLILDPNLNDNDRFLEESDFYNGLEKPMESGEIIEIILEVQGYGHNKNILCQLSDATLKITPETLRITYQFFPKLREDGSVESYNFRIFKGENENNPFTHTDRKYLNIKVIKALRDVEADLKNSKKSPLNVLLKAYDIEKSKLEAIAQSIKQQNDQVLSLGELKDLDNRMNLRFKDFVDISPDSIELGTNEVSVNRVLSSLKVLLGGRAITDSSLGLTNILYITLMLLSIEDRTIPSFISKNIFTELQKTDKESILNDSYEADAEGNMTLISDLMEGLEAKLYEFMDLNNPIDEGITILAIEEPEAHLHPAIQRTIYRDVFENSNTSVLMTTHSTHIASITPLQSILHLYKGEQETKACSSANLSLEAEDYSDLARYIDANRGEIYFGRGVLLVEGITEEYLVPKFADLMEKPLDYKGIIVCNINSTNFSPYVKLLSALGIPYAVITDGDYYEFIDEERKYHRLKSPEIEEFGYLGLEIIEKIMLELRIIEESEAPENESHWDKDIRFRSKGFFVGEYTSEVDLMINCSDDTESNDILISLFEDLTNGGEKQKTNFRDNLNKEDFWACLRQIESSHSGIGKGRFSQRLAQKCTLAHMPGHIEEAIDYIYKEV
ncbi:ATP-dependent endonuclease [Paenibacillus sp. DR312]|uniref:ATP-dependent nuclease n=1 Tax=Paenibacillus sp. DR312 TaxID=2871175 RepID=UPI001C97D246|nr:AAA family ATPase [Paenibacillus sp. DR312]QZN78719.1 AAA family ATPase [Paenibacillus sp. DR312]